MVYPTKLSVYCREGNVGSLSFVVANTDGRFKAAIVNDKDELIKWIGRRVWTEHIARRHAMFAYMEYWETENLKLQT